jgi:formylglycine-generating enzyme required for sulfatase activity
MFIRPIRFMLLISGTLLAASFATDAQAQLFPVPTAAVPASDLQLDGPIHDYEMGVHEVSNAQFAAFLNDAEFHNEVQNPGFGDERGDNIRFRPPPFDFGDVGLVDGSEADGVFDISRSLLTYSSALAVGARYGVTPSKEDHPAVGMSWIGAAKFCNWLTIDHGLGLDQRCYAEGEGEANWFPVTIGNEVGGSKAATYATRDLDDEERWALVHDLRGFRLPMDGGGTAVGSVNAVPRAFNEWYKAAAYDPAAPNFARTALPGTFEQHTVLSEHWIHGYGRDPLGNPDANFRASGDPFDNPDPAVIATTPGGYYDGSDHGGVFQTTADANHYGLFDVSGNIWEFLTDQVAISAGPIPDKSIVGGSYRSNMNQVTPANRGDIESTTTRPVVGFRVMRVPTAPAFEDVGGGTQGIAGIPRLVGLGPLTPGSIVVVALRRAPPNGLMMIWVSFQSIPQPFFGGIFHSIPASLQVVVISDTQGDLSVPATWPGGVPAGVNMWIQYLIQDISVVYGFTLSNAVKATTP